MCAKLLLIFVLFATAVVAPANGQTQQFKVFVRDVNGSPIVGAQFRCADRRRRTITQADGSGSAMLDVGACEQNEFEVAAPGFSAERLRLKVGDFGPTILVLHPTDIAAEVNVTGVSSAIGDTALSVVSIGRDRLETSGALTLDDRLRQVPGFTLFRRSGSSTANPTTQGVSLRGVGASGASRAIVLKDRIPLNDPFGGWVYWGRVPAESVAEVEVLRGSASDIFGNGAVGGVVAINTVKPTSDPYGSVDVSYGSRRTPFFSGYGSSGLGPLVGSIGAEFFRTDGSIPVEKGSRGAVDVPANVRRSTLSPRLEWRSSGDSRIFAAGDYYHEARANGSPLQNNDTLIRSVSIGGDFASGKLGKLALRSYFLDEIYHQSFSSISADRNAESLNRLQSVPSQVLAISGQWSATLGRNVLLAGFDLRHIRGRSDETAISQSRPTVRTSAGGRETSGGAYLGAVINSLPRFIVSAGLRLDRWHESGGYSSSLALATGLSDVTRFPVRDENAFSPRISVLFRATGSISLTATYGNSFRQPTLNELYRSFRVGNVLTLANAGLKAERGRDIEGSFIFNGFSQRLYVRAGAFCTAIENAVSNSTVSVTPALITRRREGIGSVRACGIEADSELRATPGVTLGLNYLYSDARVRRQPANPALEGLLLPQIARHQLTAHAMFSRSKLGTASIQLRASGPQFEDDQNLLPLAGCVTVDAMVSHPLTPRVAIYAAAENITNSRIEAGRTPVITLAGERSFRIGLRLKLSGK